MLITAKGRWVAPFSPYNTFDARLHVDRQQVVVVYSDDEGALWRHSSMMRFKEAESGGAEAWVTQVSDGRLLGTAWHTDLSEEDRELPNTFALSADEGATWSATASTGILGNTTALTPLDDDRAAFVHVRRRSEEPIGIYVAIVRPSTTNFGLEHCECVWSQEHATQSRDDASHDNWLDFNFGEPCLTALPDGTHLLVFWYLDDTGGGIRYLRLCLPD